MMEECEIHGEHMNWRDDGWGNLYCKAPLEVKAHDGTMVELKVKCNRAPIAGTKGRIG